MFVQLVTQAAHKMWYFTRGRFSMGFVGNENYWKVSFLQHRLYIAAEERRKTDSLRVC